MKILILGNAPYKIQSVTAKYDTLVGQEEYKNLRGVIKTPEPDSDSSKPTTRKEFVGLATVGLRRGGRFFFPQLS